MPTQFQPLALPNGFIPIEQTDFATDKVADTVQHELLLRDGAVEAEVLVKTMTLNKPVREIAERLAAEAERSANARDISIQNGTIGDAEVATLRFAVEGNDFAWVTFVYPEGARRTWVRAAAPSDSLSSLEQHLLHQVEAVAHNPAEPADHRAQALTWGGFLIGALITTWALKNRRRLAQAERHR